MTCLRGCAKPATRRGLCRGCYQSAWSLVRAGRTTWANLERTGKALPAGKVQSWLLDKAGSGPSAAPSDGDRDTLGDALPLPPERP